MNFSRAVGTALTSIVFFVSAVTAPADENYLYRYTDDSDAVRFRAKQEIPKKYRSCAHRVTTINITKVKTSRTKSRFSATLVKTSSSGIVKRNGLLFTSATFNGAVTKRVIIDTGSEHTIIGARLLAVIAPQKPGLLKNIKTVGGTKTARRIRLNKISIGGAQVVKLDCLALDLDLPSGAGAIIGIDFLSQFVFEIDGQKLKFVKLAGTKF